MPAEHWILYISYSSMRQRAYDGGPRTARRRRRSRRGAFAQPFIISPTKIYKSAYTAKLARFFRQPQDGMRYLSTKIYKNIYAYVRAWISEGSAFRTL